jgi:hypothetical protein
MTKAFEGKLTYNELTYIEFEVSTTDKITIRAEGEFQEEPIDYLLKLQKTISSCLDMLKEAGPIKFEMEKV